MIVLSRGLKHGWSRSCLWFITFFSILLVSSTVFGGTIFSNPEFVSSSGLNFPKEVDKSTPKLAQVVNPGKFLLLGFTDVRMNDQVLLKDLGGGKFMATVKRTGQTKTLFFSGSEIKPAEFD